MMQRSFMANVMVLLCAISLGACGGGDGGNGGAPTGTGNPTGGGGTPVNINIVGGSVQGQALTLQGIVTTWAGLIPATDGTSDNAHFSFPTGVASDGKDLYIADTGDQTIRKLALADNSGYVSTIAGTGSPGKDNGSIALATFNTPTAVAIAPASANLPNPKIYVADSGNNQIRMIDLNTSTVSLIAGAADGSSGNADSTDGTGATATFHNPEGLAINDTGTTLYVADTNNNCIRQIDLTTTNNVTNYAVTTIASTTGILSAPKGLAFANNKLYVADTNNQVIRVVDLGTAGDPVTTLAGDGQAGFADNVDPSLASFNYPQGVAVAADATGTPTTVYVTDSSNYRIRAIDLASGAVTTYAGNGTAGDTNNTTNPANAEFNYPRDLAIIGNDIYDTDNGSNTIRVINKTNGVTTIAGYSSLRNPDGFYTSSEFFQPAAATTDGNYIYVADTSANAIREINIATGQVSTLTDDNPNGSTPGLSSPLAITNDGTYLYIADANGRVYKVQISNPSNPLPVINGLQSPKSITALGTFLYVVENNTLNPIADVKEINKDTMKITSTVASSMISPEGITTDGTNLYVTESAPASSYYAVVQIDMTQSSHPVTTLVSGDGKTTLPMLYRPSGITSDGTNLYITTENAIVKMNISTLDVSTLAGSQTPGYTDSFGNKAPLFNLPLGITTDGNSLYITDSGNNNIRLLQ